MNRREFVKDMTLAGLLLNVAPKLFSGGTAAGAAPAAGPDLAFIMGDSPAAIVKKALETLGGIGKFVSRGDVVMIKPNIGWDRTPELAACTNPEVVKTLVELALGAGAKKVVVMDNTTNQAQRCYVRSGIQAAAKAAGADVPFVNPRRVKKMAIKGEWLKDWDIIQDFVEADKLINVPIAKHHSLAKLTMAHKNWMGMMGGDRGKIHQQIDHALVDLSLVIKPCLTVLDAVRILTAHGPKGGNAADVKKLDTVIAGVNQVSIDAYGATLFGRTGADLGYVVNGAQRGLGVMDLGKLSIRKLEA